MTPVASTQPKRPQTTSNELLEDLDELPQLASSQDATDGIRLRRALQDGQEPVHRAH